MTHTMSFDVIPSGSPTASESQHHFNDSNSERGQTDVDMTLMDDTLHSGNRSDRGEILRPYIYGAAGSDVC